MTGARQAVLEFDEEVQAPWRPRLVPAVGAEAEREGRAPASGRPRPSSGTPSRVGSCRPDGAAGARTTPARRGVPVASSPSVRPPRGPAAARPAVGRPARSRVRLTRRAHRLAVVLALAAGVALGSWLAPLVEGGGGDLQLAGTSSVVVQAGDTLWSIAGSVAGDRDVRVVVDVIQQLNELDGTVLVPGQVLVLP